MKLDASPKAIMAITLIAMLGLLFGVAGYLVINKSQINLPVIITPTPTEEKVTIITDKTEYEQGESVRIIFQNNLKRDIILSHCELSSFPVIQKFKNNKWELGGKKLWKYQGCEFKISANDQEIYIWDQKDNNKLLLPGIYRVNTGSIFLLEVNEKIGDDTKTRLFISNEFTIKEKTAVDPRCGQKAKISETCSVVGFEFNLNEEKCVVVNGAGCIDNLPFGTLEECQKVCEN